MLNKGLAIVVLLGAGTTPAVAQEARRLDFGVRAKVVHDTNVARSDQTQAALRGVTPEDTIFTPSLTFDVFFPVSKQSIFLNGGIGYDFHRKNVKLDSEAMDLNAGANARIGPCQPTILASYLRRQSDLQDLGLVNPENIIETSSIDLSVNCAREVGFGIGATLGRGWSNNSNPVQAQLDHNSSSAGASVSYQNHALGSLILMGQYQKVEYENRAVMDLLSTGYEMTSFGLTFERRISSRLQAKLSMAQTNVDQLQSRPASASSSFSGLTYGGDVTFRPTTRLRAQLNYERAVTPSNYIGKLYDVAETVRVSGDYQVGSRVTVGVGAERRNVKSEGATLAIGPSILLTDSEINTLFGVLTFRQSERLVFNFDMQHEEREANNPVFDYSATRIGATASVAF